MTGEWSGCSHGSRLQVRWNGPHHWPPVLGGIVACCDVYLWDWPELAEAIRGLECFARGYAESAHRFVFRASGCADPIVVGPVYVLTECCRALAGEG